jgi:hypothetical protein
MLTPLDDSPWHQIPDTFDHVGTSDPRFFDRLWFAASDPAGSGTLQFTLGVYQNMNVVDGGFVVIHDGRQHNVRASRRLRPRYEIDVAPLAIEVVEPMQHLHLSVAPGGHGIAAELDWRAVLEPEEEPQHHGRRDGRVVEDYKRMDQIGACSGWFDVGNGRVDVRDWWACRDHSWGVRERVGIAEPATNEPPERPAGSFFAFLFYSTSAVGGHVQVAGAPGHPASTSVRITRLDDTGDGGDGHGAAVAGATVDVAAEFSDDGRPRRVRRGRFTLGGTGAGTTIEVEALGPAVAMPGLGYGGYHDGLGLGVYRGAAHVEHDVWDVTHPAEVVLGDGSRARPVHRIQPVRVVQHGPEGTSAGTGSLTFICEGDLADLGVSSL